MKLNNGRNPFSFSGPIIGSGKVEIQAGGPHAPLVLDGKTPNTMQGTWSIKTGSVVLAKQAGIDAMSGAIIVGGNSDLMWQGSNQLGDSATVQLLGSDKSGASLNLNGFSETIAGLTMATGAKVLTNGGVLSVRELTLAGKSLPKGIYTSSTGWLQGNGYVVVGDVKRVVVSGVIDDPNHTIGAGNLAVLKSASTFKLPDGECSVAAIGDFPLTLISGGSKAGFGGFLTGNVALRIESTVDHPLEISGLPSNSFKGITALAHGVLKLNKPANAIAIPGNLVMGGSALENKADAVIWMADGQIAPSAVVTLQGNQSSYLDLNGHKVVISKLQLSKAGRVRTGQGGTLHLKQLFIDGQRLKDGTYQSSEPWMEGTGAVTVDSRVDIQGTIGSPEVAIGPGNIGNLTGNTKIAYPSSGGDFDIATNGFTLALDSGDGNAFAYSGSISGTGNVQFFMGPSYTGFRDAPMHLVGKKPNTSTGKFLVKKGRVSLGKPEGIDAISGDVIVGGQGFNDCLFWQNSHQLKDTVNITLLDAGNNGAAYLHLNGCRETAGSLTMTVNNKVLTDSAKGVSGELIVKSLTIGGVVKPAGTYSANTEKWIEGKGKVTVRP